jgi:endo-1,4-beta-xylanase
MGALPDDAGTITWSPAVVWPPNHKLVPITISWTENGEGLDSNTLKVTGITSMGADGQGTGSGQPTAKQGPDYTGVGNSATASDGSAATLTVDVRAERAGTDKAGRTYMIHLSCQSGMEPAGSSTAVVTVPHDMGNNTTSTSSSKH